MGVDDASYNDTIMILQLLRDNLTLWQAQMAENAQGADSADEEEQDQDIQSVHLAGSDASRVLTLLQDNLQSWHHD